MQNTRFLTLLCLLMVVFMRLPASAANKVTCYTLWDDSFLYVAAEVQDPDVEGTNTTHMSNPWEDDSIEVFVDRSGNHGKVRTPGTYQMSVSAAGGSSWLIGENGQPKPKKIYSFKYDTTVQGTINRPDDKDIGYTVELAMPWREMGGAPVSGEKLGFNIVCRLKGETDSFVSFSPKIKTAADIQDPELWGKIKFVDSPTIIAFEDGAVVCRKIRQRAPVIDGRLGPGEWQREMKFQIAIPEPTGPRPVHKQKFVLEKLALTPYYFWNQKEEPGGPDASRFAREDDINSMKTDHPFEGTGPWYSSNNVQWHKDQLANVKEAGIDVILPVYFGDAHYRGMYADSGLKSMVQALKEMKAEGKSYPLIGMFFDTGSMAAQRYGAASDFTSDEVNQTFYGMMKDFFLNVPDEFRASIQLPEEKGGGSGYIIDLSSAKPLQKVDSGIIEYCNKRFADDFGGKKLIWLGDANFKADGVTTLDGYAVTTEAPKPTDAGWIRTTVVRPGGCDYAENGCRSRMSGKTYGDDWSAAIDKGSDWVVVDSWNGIHNGTDICSTMEYGNHFMDLTRINMLSFNGMRFFDAKYLKHNTPSVMLPDALYQVNLTFKNSGTKAWYPGIQGISLGCRWFKDGTLFADSGLRIALQDMVLPAQSVNKMIGIRTVDSEGKPLPEGDYELRFDLAKTRDDWFSNGGDIPLRVPVRIGKPATDGFTLVESNLPTHMKAGAVYNVKLKVRNDGPTTWKAGTKVGYDWYKASVYLKGNSAESASPVGTSDSATALIADVEPGRDAELTVPVTAQMAALKPSDLATYVCKWDVMVDGKGIGSAGIGSAAETVDLMADDIAPKFISSDAPIKMDAGKPIKVNLTIANNGLTTWKKGEFEVGCRWYYLDGVSEPAVSGKTNISAEVKPGAQTVVKVGFNPPSYDGQYYLVWDLIQGDAQGQMWLSDKTSIHGGNTLKTLVTVANGKLVAADLSKVYDTDVTSFDMNPADGNADGKGDTLPAEYLPPMVTMGIPESKLWPSGMWHMMSDQVIPNRVSFLYPSKADGAKNAITCKGQTVALKADRYSAVHILAFATEDASGAFGLTYNGKKSTANVKFSSWDAPSKNGESPGFVCPLRRTMLGDQFGTDYYINDDELKADPTSTLTSITLPNQPSVKVMAITCVKVK